MDGYDSSSARENRKAEIFPSFLNSSKEETEQSSFFFFDVQVSRFILHENPLQELFFELDFKTLEGDLCLL